jgi:uncharacterized integral membrane protein (TIGR00697 family)
MSNPVKSTPAERPASSYHLFDLIIGIFVTVLIISNIASSAKIVDWGFSLFGVQMAFDAGTLLFPVSYIFGDVLTEVYGYRRSRRVIWTGFICLALSALVLWLVRVLPGEATWQDYAGQAAFVAILGGMSSGGIVLASLAGYWSGEFSNSFIMAKMKILTRGRWLWTRTIGSTIFGEGVDSLLFYPLAFYGAGIIPDDKLPLVMAAQFATKVAVEVLFTPVTYKVVALLKRAENEDYYDRRTNFNPFTLKA